MVENAIQLYTLREIDATLPELIARVGEMAFDGVEFAGLGDADPSEVANALDDAGLAAAGAHVGLDDLAADPAGVAETYRRLGCETLVVPYLEETYFDSEAAAAETAERLAALAGDLDAEGARLAYHNHDHEFVDAGDRAGFDAFLDAAEVNVELDVGWVVAAGRDPTALLDRLAGRAPLVHVKDVRDGRPVELGDGELSVEECVRAARDAGAEWLVYEHDDPDDPERSLERGAELLAGFGD